MLQLFQWFEYVHFIRFQSGIPISNILAIKPQYTRIEIGNITIFVCFAITTIFFFSWLQQLMIKGNEQTFGQSHFDMIKFIYIFFVVCVFLISIGYIHIMRKQRYNEFKTHWFRTILISLVMLSSLFLQLRFLDQFEMISHVNLWKFLLVEKIQSILWILTVILDEHFDCYQCFQKIDEMRGYSILQKFTALSLFDAIYAQCGDDENETIENQIRDAASQNNGDNRHDTSMGDTFYGHRNTRVTDSVYYIDDHNNTSASVTDYYYL